MPWQAAITQGSAPDERNDVLEVNIVTRRLRTGSIIPQNGLGEQLALLEVRRPLKNPVFWLGAISAAEQERRAAGVIADRVDYLQATRAISQGRSAWRAIQCSPPASALSMASPTDFGTSALRLQMGFQSSEIRAEIVGAVPDSDARRAAARPIAT